jgi:hypothetical protein
MRGLTFLWLLLLLCGARAGAVFVRHDGQWWIEAYHNVDVKTSARTR